MLGFIKHMIVWRVSPGFWSFFKGLGLISIMLGIFANEWPRFLIGNLAFCFGVYMHIWVNAHRDCGTIFLEEKSSVD